MNEMMMSELAGLGIRPPKGVEVPEQEEGRCQVCRAELPDGGRAHRRTCSAKCRKRLSRVAKDWSDTSRPRRGAPRAIEDVAAWAKRHGWEVNAYPIKGLPER